MKIITTSKPQDLGKAGLTLVPLFEGEQNIAAKEAGEDFKGTLGEAYLLRRTLLIGLGKRSEYTLERLRTATAGAAPTIQKLRIGKLAIILKPALSRGKKGPEETTQALLEGLLLSCYRFTDYKTLKPGEEPAEIVEIQLILPDARDKSRVQKAATSAQAIWEAVRFARNLGNHPGNIATPSHLAKHGEDLAKTYPINLKVKILHRADIKKENMGALLAVAQGTDEEPKFIILEYTGKRSAPTIVLVGKGITFDSGGISLKPGDKMEEMKFDMAGGATVMGIIKAAAELKLPVNLVGLIPATENLPSGKAIKPGDIIRARNGKTIEIVNTDAEGRLVLADALDYARKYHPALVIDFATLTGAIVAALGDDITGAFSNDKRALAKLQTAAKITGEKIWPMPLESDYDQFIKSDFADLRNIGTMRFADATNAANFLKNFVDYPWIHLDIAGTAWATREKPYRPKGATGTGVRLTIEFLKNFKSR